mgnify:CR=1 FL=1
MKKTHLLLPFVPWQRRARGWRCKRSHREMFHGLKSRVIGCFSHLSLRIVKDVPHWHWRVSSASAGLVHGYAHGFVEDLRIVGFGVVAPHVAVVFPVVTDEAGFLVGEGIIGEPTQKRIQRVGHVLSTTVIACFCRVRYLGSAVELDRAFSGVFMV